jgi:hypothetical protein
MNQIYFQISIDKKLSEKQKYCPGIERATQIAKI